MAQHRKTHAEVAVKFELNVSNLTDVGFGDKESQFLVPLTETAVRTACSGAFPGKIAEIANPTGAPHE